MEKRRGNNADDGGDDRKRDCGKIIVTSSKPLKSHIANNDDNHAIVYQVNSRRQVSKKGRRKKTSATRTKEKRPSFLDQTSKELATERSKTEYEGVKKGPIMDSAADRPVIGVRDWKHATGKAVMGQGVAIEGIFGTETVKEKGNLKVGGRTAMGGLRVPQAAESVVPIHDICIQEKSWYMQSGEGAWIYDPGKQTIQECPAEGTMYRLPTAKGGTKVASLEIIQAAIKAKKVREEVLRVSILEHQKCVHRPKHPLCKTCDEAAPNKGVFKKGIEDRKMVVTEKYKEDVLNLGIDLAVEMPKDHDGNIHVLHVVEKVSGIGQAEGCKTRGSKEMLLKIQRMVASIRQWCGMERKIILRLHS